MKVVLLSIALCTTLLAESSAVDIYSPSTLHGISQRLAAQRTPFASQPLRKYGDHYTMVAYRSATGSSEVHKTEADLFVAVEGSADLITGGTMVGAHSQSPNELRGTSIRGGERHSLTAGSVIHIPAGVPHQLLVTSGTPFTYFVLKVVEHP